MLKKHWHCVESHAINCKLTFTQPFHECRLRPGSEPTDAITASTRHPNQESNTEIATYEEKNIIMIIHRRYLFDSSQA
jgi:hypothetical protein